MSAYFIKPPYADIRFPPILDKFSRTLAAPLSSQKFNLSISARIGSNYTSSARTLHFDNESKGVQMLPVPY
jgi:dynein heavy chain